MHGVQAEFKIMHFCLLAVPFPFTPGCKKPYGNFPRLRVIACLPALSDQQGVTQAFKHLATGEKPVQTTG